MAKLNEDKLLEFSGEVFAETVPKICELIKEFDNEDKYAAIGASMQTILSALVNFCLYNKYEIADIEESLKWQKNIAEQLVSILSEVSEAQDD